MERFFPKALIAGIQVGLGIKLAMGGTKFVMEEMALGIPVGIAMIFLTIDKVGTVMEMPFSDDETHHVDMAKSIRRTDKTLSSLYGLWSGRPLPHHDLFPEKPKKVHECAPENRNAYTDGALTIPRRPDLVVGGCGVWLPEEEGGQDFL